METKQTNTETDTRSMRDSGGRWIMNNTARNATYILTRQSDAMGGTTSQQITAYQANQLLMNLGLTRADIRATLDRSYVAPVTVDYVTLTGN